MIPYDKSRVSLFTDEKIVDKDTNLPYVRNVPSVDRNTFYEIHLSNKRASFKDKFDAKVNIDKMHTLPMRQRYHESHRVYINKST